MLKREQNPRNTAPLLTLSIKWKISHCFYIAPLQLDKLHSSPKEVTTYYGLPVELRCAFKYGAPPVRVVIVRKEKIIANQENGTQKVKITVEGLNKDYGSYTCVAEDVNNNKITHQMEIKKIGESVGLVAVSPQVAQAQNMSVGTVA